MVRGGVEFWSEEALRMDRRFKFIVFLAAICFVFVLSPATLAQANNAPVVTNVYAQQRPGTRLIDINYDVADADGDLLEITVVVSNDGGETYGIVPAFLTGDVGKGISPGMDKRIVWDVEMDRGHIEGENFKVRIIADDGHESAPDMRVSQSSIDFGEVAEGESSEQTFTIYNDGDAVLQITSVKSNSSQFVIVTQPDEVPPGGAASVKVKFSSSSSGVKTGTITIASNDPDVPSKSITIKGTLLSSSIIGKDGAEMVLIPGGEFEMGDAFNEGNSDERPVHTVYVSSFYMDEHEVTNAQYRRFVQETGHSEPNGFYLSQEHGWVDGVTPWDMEGFNFDTDSRPVVCVSWEDAKAYAEWADKQLPTEAEWEKAARGGLVGKRYVWGNASPVPKRVGNIQDETARRSYPNWDIIFEGYDDGYLYTSPVGIYEPNGYGLYDMLGNVWEWCADWYSGTYYGYSPSENPSGPGTRTDRTMRGGSWNSTQTTVRVSYRSSDPPTHANLYTGFRCVQKP